MTLKKEVRMKLVRVIRPFLGMLALLGVCAALSVPNAVAEPPKVYRVEARTTTFGGTGYVLGFGACDILNKKSQWVRGSVLESSGTPENIKVVGMDPEKRKHTFFTTSYEMFVLAKKGEGLFKQNSDKFKDLQVMINEQKLVAFIITLDPSIRTLDQLKGKRVATWGKGTTKYEMTYNLIAGAGKDVVDSIHWQYTGYNGYDDMISGKTDAAIAFSPEIGKGLFSVVPQMKELMSKRTVYFVTATPDMRKRSAELFGDAYGASMTLPKGTYGENSPREDVLGFAIVIAWCVYPEMPEDVVYEIVKTLHENYKMLPDYHPAGKSWFPENFGTYPARKEDYHRGARKYYDEKGIPYGREWYQKVYESYNTTK
jgi:TRAP transporter TAXI family solute receptor